MSFFFSSRRRHTRWPRDWSSDVCSSDLRITKSVALPTQRLWLVTHTRRSYLFVHNQESAETVKIILITLARKVISEIADVGSFADISEMSQAVGADRKLRKHTVVTLLRHCFVTLGQVSTLDSHPHHVAVHAGAGRFEPVAFEPAFVYYLIPEPGYRILISFKSLGQLLHDFDQSISLRMILGQNLE